MVLLPELERVLMEDALPPDRYAEPSVMLVDITKQFDDMVSQIKQKDMITTNYFVLLENKANDKWRIISTEKPLYKRGYSNCDVNVVKYSGKGGKITGGPTVLNYLDGETEWDDVHPRLPLPETLARVLLEEAKSEMRKGFTLAYASIEDAKAGNGHIFPENTFQKTDLKADPKYRQAVSELVGYLTNIRNKFESQGKHLQAVFVEYSVTNWRYNSAAPWRSVMKDARKELDFVKDLTCIDPYGSNDGGTHYIELEPSEDRETIELYAIGYHGKATGQLDKERFESDVLTVYLDAITYFA